MKNFLFLFLFLPLFANAQDALYGYSNYNDSKKVIDKRNNPYIKKDTLYFPNGLKFWKGETLKLGYGSSPTKNFNFIYASPTSWSKGLFGVGNGKLSQDFYHKKIVVKNLKRVGNRRHGYHYYLVVGIGGAIENYWCDIIGAIHNKEVIIPGYNDQEIKISRTGESVADRLTKLSNLLEKGYITKEEFEKQKKKILNE